MPRSTVPLAWRVAIGLGGQGTALGLGLRYGQGQVYVERVRRYLPNWPARKKWVNIGASVQPGDDVEVWMRLKAKAYAVEQNARILRLNPSLSP